MILKSLSLNGFIKVSSSSKKLRLFSSFLPVMEKSMLDYNFLIELS